MELHFQTLLLSGWSCPLVLMNHANKMLLASRNSVSGNNSLVYRRKIRFLWQNIGLDLKKMAAFLVADNTHRLKRRGSEVETLRVYATWPLRAQTWAGPHHKRIAHFSETHNRMWPETVTFDPQRARSMANGHWAIRGGTKVESR